MIALRWLCVDIIHFLGFAGVFGGGVYAGIRSGLCFFTACDGSYFWVCLVPEFVFGFRIGLWVFDCVLWWP